MPLSNLPSGYSATELVRDRIKEILPSLVNGTSLFVSYHVSTEADPDLVVMVLQGPDAEPELTMGTVVAIEHTRVDVIVYGAPGQYKVPRNVAKVIRYNLLATKEYTAGGLRLIAIMPAGNIDELGKDPLERNQFLLKFDVQTDPEYV